ncbi:HAMP domain-containing protein, partial [bacterium]|nr:HAMP domain-containing protein [bacterium]
MINRGFDQFLRRIPVRVRIIGGFLLVLLLASVVSATLLGNFNSVVNRLEQFTNVDAKVERLLLTTSRRVATSQLNLNRYIQDYVPSPYAALDDVDQAVATLNDGLALAIDSGTADNLSLIIQSLTDYKLQITELEKAQTAGDTSQATRLESKLQKLGNDISVRLELMVDSNVKEVTAANATVLRDAQNSLQTGMILMIIGLFLAVVFSILITISITRPLADVRAGTESFQQGNLSAEIQTTGNDEFTVIARIFNNLARQIRELITDLEKRVADRTKALATSTEVSRRLSTIINQDELVTEVVNQVSDAFGYYHAQIYFFDEHKENLVKPGGTGDDGKDILSKAQQISVGGGSVGRSA